MASRKKSPPKSSVKDRKSPKSQRAGKRSAPKKLPPSSKTTARRATKAQLAAAIIALGGEPKKRATRKTLVAQLGGHKAQVTKAKKREAFEKRSAASRRGWATHRQKSKETRDWEKERARIHRAEEKAIDESKKVGMPQLHVFRWYNGYYLNVSELSVQQIGGILIRWKQHGVRLFFAQREVQVGEYATGGSKSKSGLLNTPNQYMSRLTERDLIFGKPRWGWPSLKSMRVPGIDWIRFIVVADSEINGFPSRIRAAWRKIPVETRDTVTGDDAQAFYLRNGRKPTKKEIAEMRDLAEEREWEDAPDDEEMGYGGEDDE